MPFEYTALLWSILLGWLAFHDLPSAKDWAGNLLLVGAGLVSVYEALKQNAKPGAPQHRTQAAVDGRPGT